MKNQNNNLTLANLEIGAIAEIVGLKEEAAVSRRLLEMGVIPGATVRVIKSAPFGCPLEIRVKNSHIAIRKSEADSILVKS